MIFEVGIASTKLGYVLSETFFFYSNIVVFLNLYRRVKTVLSFLQFVKVYSLDKFTNIHYIIL